MKWWLRRRKRAQTEPDPASQDRIAILEHELLGVQHEPGTAAARAVAIAKPVDPGQCPHDDVINITEIQHLRQVGMCAACGADMVENDDGDWERP